MWRTGAFRLRILLPVLGAVAVSACLDAPQPPEGASTEPLAGRGASEDRAAPAPPTEAASRPRDVAVPSAPGPPEPGEEPGGVSPTRPVLLVPGWLDTGRQLAALRLRLLSAGWPEGWVVAVTFEDPTGGNREHADELHLAILALQASTGQDTVDIVAHSMGGLATRWYLLQEDAEPVRRVAFLATPHHGTVSAHLAWGDGRDEMLPESPFLDTLNAAPPVPPSVEAITVRTRIDTHVIPASNGQLEGVPDFEVCCPIHAALPDDPEVFRVVRRFLETGVGTAPEAP